jgi:hypothetical protein
MASRIFRLRERQAVARLCHFTLEPVHREQIIRRVRPCANKMSQNTCGRSCTSATALGLGFLESPVRTMVACYRWGACLGDVASRGHPPHDPPTANGRGDEQRQIRDQYVVGSREATSSGH